MKISLLSTGKTEEGYLTSGIGLYLKRLRHYIPFEMVEVAPVRKTAGMTPEMIKAREAELLMKHLEKADAVVLLDEHGTEFTSVEFSTFLQKRMNTGIRELVFVVGGAWGFADVLHKKADFKIALSRMTFSHQMVRLFFVEQLYRAFTILKGENYHNE
jgi:23S rRNA (pseudouridine1915-N3)-methyltransferase